MAKKDTGGITNRIVRTQDVAWKNLEWLQNPRLKDMTRRAFERLKNSLRKNQFLMPFNVWEEKEGKVWILDGHHRQRALRELETEGVKIPDMLTANFISCKNRKEAVGLVLIYSSVYANVTEDGLYETIATEGLDFDEMKLDLELPLIDLDKFEAGYLKDPGAGEGAGEGEGGGEGGENRPKVAEKDSNIIVTVSFHPAVWLGKREEILGVFGDMERAYECTIKANE